MDEKKLSDTQLDINGAIGDLADLCSEKIKETLKAFGLPEPVIQAIWELEGCGTMLNLYIAKGDPYVKNADVGEDVANILEKLKILDEACQERIQAIGETSL